MNKIDELNEKLDRIREINVTSALEIDKLRVEILRLKIASNQSKALGNQDSLPTKEVFLKTEKSEITQTDFTDIPQAVSEEIENEDAPISDSFSGSDDITSVKSEEYETSYEPKKSFNFEKLIGENLINKVGILITIIGVAIGAKYSIDNDLISPLTRIILGYIFGVGLLAVGLKLKEKYTNYSAVLVSGAMAIMYFITFFAFNFYGLISQGVAFGLMVIFTIFTVLAALSYDRQVIAHIGLVGAVAVPFLLSDGSGNVVFMFSYLLLICIGVFVISLKRDWKILFYSIFGFSWCIFGSWLLLDAKLDTSHFSIALGFLVAFFLLFYAIFVTYKLLKKEQYQFPDIAILILNTVIFFGLGYFILDSNPATQNYLGLFAISNAVIHFSVARLIQSKNLADKNLFYLVTGLVLVFITLAIPIQLDGNYVTIMWACEAALLFWIGRTKNVPFYEIYLLRTARIDGREPWRRLGS